MRTWLGVMLAALAGLALASVGLAQGPGMMGPGMMGPGAGWGPMGPGPMGPGWGWGGMGSGMMGNWAPTPDAKPISIDQAQQAVQTYLDWLGNRDLVIDEVMEFEQNFYAIVKEKSTDKGAFELLINRWTGAVRPEPGPNMMWNTKYGMMGRGMMGFWHPTGEPTVSADAASRIAQRWLDQYEPGSTLEKPDVFYGYYTLHFLKNGKIAGMLSVNAYGGQVWYHTWHGAFLQMKEAAKGA